MEVEEEKGSNKGVCGPGEQCPVQEGRGEVGWRGIGCSVSVGICKEAKHSRAVLGQRVSWCYTLGSSGDLKHRLLINPY